MSIELEPSQPPLRRSVPPHPLIRPLQLRDRDRLKELVSQDGLFRSEEVSVALELIDVALDSPAGPYRVLVGELDGRLAGYVCFGPTPMTDGTWDLYWIATHPEARERGVARALTQRMEEQLRLLGARLVRVETSNLDDYGAAHAFYERLDYPVVARLPDFYRSGDDLLVMVKRL